MIEILSNVESSGPGRRNSKRTTELADALSVAKSKGAAGMRVSLEEGESEKFHRFTQRCRHAAELAGVKVSISKDGDGFANVRIVESVPKE